MFRGKGQGVRRDCHRTWIRIWGAGHLLSQTRYCTSLAWSVSVHIVSCEMMLSGRTVAIEIPDAQDQIERIVATWEKRRSKSK